MGCGRFAIFVGISVSVLILSYFGIPWFYGRWLRLWLCIRAVRQKTLVLTFDDGPGSRLTPAVLDILSDYDAKATFFLLGRNIVGRESIVKRIYDEGHEICSHGYDHINHWKALPGRTLADIEKGWQAINRAMGRNDCAYPFRPPYGKLNLISLLCLWIRRVPIYYWTLVSSDTWPAGKRDSQRIAMLAGKAGGGVSLAHDFDRLDESVDDLVLKSLRAALIMAKQTGMKIRTISDLVGQRE